jgi:ABC-type multidrug transport system permease subunit
MIIGFIFIAAIVLPFLWEHIFRLYVVRPTPPTIVELTLISIIPFALTISLLLIIGDSKPEIEIMMVFAMLIALISTFTWGYASIYREVMRFWLWLYMTISTLILYPVLHLIVVFGSRGSLNFQF